MVDWTTVLVVVGFTAITVPIVDLATVYIISKKLFHVDLFERAKDKVGGYLGYRQYNSAGAKIADVELSVDELTAMGVEGWGMEEKKRTYEKLEQLQENIKKLKEKGFK